MGWLSAFIMANLIGIGSNLDNCGIGIAYGSDKIRFPHGINTLVNTIGFCTALIGAYAGTIISHFLTAYQSEWAACIILVCIGLFFWHTAYIHPRIFKKKKQMKMKEPGWKEGIILGFVLSSTNIASGFGEAVSHAANMWITTAFITIWGYIMIWFGNAVGIGIVAKLLGKYSSFTSGLLLILVGIYQVRG